LKKRQPEGRWHRLISAGHHRILPFFPAALLLLPACSDSPSGPEDPFDTPPITALLDRDLSPAIPDGLNIRISCNDGPDVPSTNGPTDECPVIQWGELVYWVYTDASNGSSMTVLAYDSDGERVGSWQRDGARYLWQITIDNTAETVTLWGQASRTIEIPWGDLRVE
jgi:hypothetical protein